MTAPPKSTALFLTALGLALVADVLFRGATWGLNLAIWTVLVCVTFFALNRVTPLRLSRATIGFGGLVVLFSVLFALRDTNFLKAANGIVILLCLGAMLLASRERSLREADVVTLVAGPAEQLVRLPREFVDLGREVQKEKEWSAAARGRGRAIGRGLMLAAPLVFVFGALFASADAIFKSKLEGLGQFDLDFGTINGHVWTTLCALVLVGGVLHRLVAHLRPPIPIAVPPAVVPPPVSNLQVFGPPVAGAPTIPIPPYTYPTSEPVDLRVGVIEIGIVLGSLAVLFGGFLLVQFRYLFAGGDLVRATAGLSFADYARSGFFELVFVSALTLAVVIGADAFLKRDRPSDDLVFRWLGRILVAMVLFIVASAMLRMKLYMDTFGLTESRIYATAFMAWLTASFAILLATTLNGLPRRFAFRSFVTGVLAVFCINVLNPERMIVRVNISKPFTDFTYLKVLSDDAVLALREFGASVPPARRAEVQELIRRRHDALVRSDWREMNATRWALAH